MLGVPLTLPPEARFASVDSVQAYVDRVAGAGAPRVRARAGASGAHYESGPGGAVVAVPAGRDGAWALRELVVLHELAHHVVATAGADGAAHGPSFTRAFVDLAARVMGPEAGLALRIVYTESGVAVG